MKLTVLFAGLIISVGGFAQTTPLTLSESVNIALNNNIRLQQEKNSLITNEASLQASKMAIVPTVNLTSNAGSQIGRSFNQQDGNVVTGTINFVSGNIGADMPIFNGFANTNTLRSDRSRFESQQYNIQRTEQEIISLVSAQFLETLLSQELLEIEKENLKFQQTSLDKILNEVELGAKAEIDKFNQISIVRTAELNVLRAEVTLRNNRTTLGQTMQLDPSTEFTVAAPEMSNLMDISELEEIDLDNQVKNRKDLISTQMMEESSKFQMMSTKSMFMPSLNAFANYSSRYNQTIVDGIDLTPTNFNDQFFDLNRSFNYGVSLNIPIFNGLRNKSQYVRDKIAYDNAILNTKDLEITAKSELQRAIRNYKDALLNYELAEAALEAAEVSFQLNKDSYELGLISLVDFSQSNRDFFRAKSDIVRAQLTLAFQDILLKDAMGTLSKEDIVE